jgi:4-amino-4-deoxy-L-arabinose transferase-like glycosyltransferase
MKHYLILLVFVLFAGFLRIYQLGTYPAGFHIDEASLGYNGYSMLKTGKDEHGIRFPLYIDMFGDNRPSGYHYLTIAPIAVFGLNEFATRLPGAVFGSISVIALYFLVYALFPNTLIALISSFLLAVSPWHIVSSRASSEAVVALFFILTGVALIVYSVQKKLIKLLPVGFLSLTLSFFFYHTPRVFVPMLLVCMIILTWGKLKNYSSYYKYVGLLLTCGVILVSILLVFVVKGGTGRFSQVNIFGSPETRLVMEQQFREDGIQHAPVIISRLFHNKVMNYSLTFVSNYFDYFSGKYLFINGGRPLWYKVPGIGMMYLVELPFIVAGFVFLLVNQHFLLKLPIVWLLIAPIVASITTDDIPNVQRSLVMFPMLEIMAAFGFIQLLTYIRKKKAVVIFIVICIFMFNVAYFLNQYIVNAPVHETLYRFNGFKEMVLSVKDVYPNYDHIVMTKTSGGIYPHVLFFMKYDPFLYQSEGSPKDPDFKGFGKFIFTPQFCPSITGDDRIPTSGKTLFVNSGTCNISSLLKQKKIYREDGTVAFILVSNQN